MAIVRLQHTNVSSALLCILKSAHAIIVTGLELADVLRVPCCHLTETLWLHVLELTSVHCDSISVEIDALTSCFSVHPHSIVDFSPTDELLPALAMRHVILEHTGVDFAVAERDLAEALLPVLDPLTFEFLAGLLNLTSVACLCTVYDFSLVERIALFENLLVVRTLHRFVLHFSQGCLLEYLRLV